MPISKARATQSLAATANHTPVAVECSGGTYVRSVAHDLGQRLGCGAHLSGLPLNWQLTSRGGRLVGCVQSAPEYRFYALPGGPPFRPGMVLVNEGGAAIDMEIWELPAREFGSFVAAIPAPLGIGKVKLADGTQVPGFTCESTASIGAEDITHLGSWRRYLARR